MAAPITPKDVARRFKRSEKRVRQIAREATYGHRRHERWLWEGWDDPDLQPVIERLENGGGFGEGGGHEEDVEWDLTVSSKNQVTLPVAALGALKVRAGDKLRAVLRGRSLVLLAHPVSWVDYFAGSAQGLYGQTKEDIDAYLREVRGDWEPRDR